MSGEDSSSIRLALVVLIGAHSGTGGYSQYSYFTDFYRFLPILTDFKVLDPHLARAPCAIDMDLVAASASASFL